MIIVARGNLSYEMPHRALFSSGSRRGLENIMMSKCLSAERRAIRDK